METAEQELDNPIKNHLVCYQQMSVRWRKREQPISDAQRFRIQSDNVKLMEVLVSSEENMEVEQSLDKDASKELKRLDAKLNLMMSWIGQLLLQQQNLPPLQAVSLSPKGMQFTCDTQALAENDNLYMEMFLEPRYPQAFVTFAKVVQVVPNDKGDEVIARFQDLNEYNQLWLDKYVFQLHRRQVAARKQHTGK